MMQSTATPAAPSPATELAVSGLNCNNCARKVTGIVQGFQTVASIAVDLNSQRATIRWKQDPQPELPAILSALDEAGYGSQVIPDGAGAPSPMLGGWAMNLAVGLPVTAVLMLGEWVFRLGDTRWFAWVAFGLAGLVQGLGGARFYRGAWAQLKAGSSNMDTLVALGSTTAFGYSTWALFAGWPGHLYFMEAAAIITLISLGHWFEARVGEKAADSLRALMTLAPQTARKVVHTNPASATVPHTGADRVEARAAESASRSASPGASPPPLPPVETEVPVSQLQSGDWVALRPGDHVPVDGEVVEGESAVDESMLTGESAPANKAALSPLYAGTRNLDGRLVMRVTATGESTALAHIIAAVQRAQTSRAGIQRLGDKVSNVFVPVVCALALGTALWWGLGFERARALHEFLGQWLWHSPLAETALAAAFIGAAAVLIVACPCAMGLATPAAIMAAANTAARRGILIRDGVALEKAGALTAVLFDKTGTLTAGKPSAVKWWIAKDSREEHVLDLAAALARHSAHPVSQAIARMSRSTDAATVAGGDSRDGLELAGWREIRGAGVEARPVTGDESKCQLRLGSQRWLQEMGVHLVDGQSFAEDWSSRGATIVGLASGTRLLGLIAIQDELKPGAAEVVRQLHRRGLKTFLITGDNPRTAAGVAREAGIIEQHVFAEVRPEHKADFVRKLQAQGERVGFVGDGINDAPALEQADLGIAVSRASDVAREAADIILLKSDIEAVPESLGLARATLRTIKQNLFWAFFYNAAAVPLAVLGFLSPVLCAAAMGVSDIVVIGNALRLRSWKSR
jgi:Cu+-exporting ATPase